MSGTLGDYARIILGGTPKTSNKEFWDGDIPWVTPGDMRDTKHISTTARSITEAGLQGSNTKLLYPGDVVISARGTVGKLMECDRPMAFNQSCYAIRTLDAELLHQGYVYYLIHDCINYLRQNAGGAVFNAIVISTLARTPVKIPPLNNQKRIASILSAYDDLIENNRRRIQLLEQAARLLYREWFVHLRFPGHEHVNITNGVPEGWGEGVVADFYSTGSGGTPSRKNPDYYTGEIPWVKTKELNGGFILSTGERITDEAVKRSSAKLFPRHTVLIAMYGATIGQTAILSVPSTTNQACCAIIQKKPGTSYAHAYLFFCHYKTDLVGLGQGAAQNNVSQQVIKSFKMVLPRKELMEAFLESVHPLFEQVEILQKSNISLVQARDLLLPRLMNGEVAV